MKFPPATSDDAEFLWREAQRYFRRAAKGGEPALVERNTRIGSGFATMAVALLKQINAKAKGPTRKRNGTAGTAGADGAFSGQCTVGLSRQSPPAQRDRSGEAGPRT